MPWNYPFHNVLNPLTAAVFAGNALVIKVGGFFMFLFQVVSICLADAMIIT